MGWELITLQPFLAATVLASVRSLAHIVQLSDSIRTIRRHATGARRTQITVLDVRFPGYIAYAPSENLVFPTTLITITMPKPLRTELSCIYGTAALSL